MHESPPPKPFVPPYGQPRAPEQRAENNASYAILTNAFRERLAQAVLGDALLKPAKYVAFGDGGHHPETNIPLPVDPDATALNNELMRVPVKKNMADDCCCADSEPENATRLRFIAAMKASLCADDNPPPFSEIGVFDEDGLLISLRHTRLKTLKPEDGEGFDYKVAIKF